MNITRLRNGAIAIAVVLAGGCAAGDGDDDAGAADLPTLQTGASGDGRDDAADEDSSGANGGDGPDEEVDPDIAMAEYEQCMADQGIDLSFGDAGEGAAVVEFGIDDEDATSEGAVAIDDLEEFEAAAEECDEILDDAFGEFELTPEQEAEFADQTLELERCLRDEGFDIDMSGDGFEISEDIDFEAFEEAMRTCEPDSQFDSVEVGP